MELRLWGPGLPGSGRLSALGVLPQNKRGFKSMTSTIEQSQPIGPVGNRSVTRLPPERPMSTAAAKVLRTGESRRRHLHFKAPPDRKRAHILLVLSTRAGVERSEVTISKAQTSFLRLGFTSGPSPQSLTTGT